MMCQTCGELVRLGVFVIERDPSSGMICWPCVVEEEE